ncbi:MAG: shikimate dehydrogenase [bacterium]|nr:shikimate dehydrogenase [bacterium]
MMSPKKKILAVIGDPVAHSLSPQMHNAALRALRLPFVYTKIHVLPEELKKFFRVEVPKLEGFNSTLPHKEKLFPFMDWVAPKARLIGAINTVVRRGKRLLGFNTDGDGFLVSLHQEQGFSLEQKNVCILGAGAAARSLGVAMATAGARRIIFHNRTIERGAKLAKYLKGHFPKVAFSYTGLEGTPFHQSLSKSDLLVNTTSLGLGQTNFGEFPWQHLPHGVLVSDIVYNPRMTPFLRSAKSQGFVIHTGEGMLVHQGALSFLLWTGRVPDTELMHRTVIKSLSRLT